MCASGRRHRVFRGRACAARALVAGDQAPGIRIGLRCSERTWRSLSFDVNDYVVDGALAGLFCTIAQQEKEIRTNPAARVTDLLKGVFGSVS